MKQESRHEFWRRHLVGVDDPLLHFLPATSLDLESLQAVSRELRFASFPMDARTIRTVSALMDAFAQAMHFPSHVGGGNWDGLLDWTRDLSWSKGEGYVLILSNADSLLSLENMGFAALLFVLEATVRDWRDERGEFGERTQPVPFHVVLSGSEALRAALLENSKEPVCDHQTDCDTQIVRTPGGVRQIDSYGDAEKLVRGGADTELVLSFLRERGVGIVDSTYVIASVMEKPVPEAKTLVDRSRTWSDEYERDMHFRNIAREALRDWGLL